MSNLTDTVKTWVGIGTGLLVAGAVARQLKRFGEEPKPIKKEKKTKVTSVFDKTNKEEPKKDRMPSFFKEYPKKKEKRSIASFLM